MHVNLCYCDSNRLGPYACMILLQWIVHTLASGDVVTMLIVA